MRYAIVKDNVIIDAAEWDGVTSWTPPEGTTAHAHATGQIGWLWNDGTPISKVPLPSPPFSEAQRDGVWDQFKQL